jgi:hypothetical protein
MVWFNFIEISLKKTPFYHGNDHKVGEENITFYLYHKVSKSLGSNQVKIHGTNSNTSKLAVGVSCAHKCIIIGSRCNVGMKPNW